MLYLTEAAGRNNSLKRHNNINFVFSLICLSFAFVIIKFSSEFKYLISGCYVVYALNLNMFNKLLL